MINLFTLALKVTDFPLEVESPSARIAVCRISFGFAVPVRKLKRITSCLKDDLRGYVNSPLPAIYST